MAADILLQVEIQQHIWVSLVDQLGRLTVTVVQRRKELKEGARRARLGWFPCPPARHCHCKAVVVAWVGRAQLAYPGRRV